MSTDLDLTTELAKLIEFVASAGIAIRMNSAYNSYAVDNPHRDVDVMWLADAIHNLDMLGRAISTGRYMHIIEACELLSSAFEHYMAPKPANASMKGDPKATFERHSDYIDVRNALAILDAIQAKTWAA